MRDFSLLAALVLLVGCPSPPPPKPPPRKVEPAPKSKPKKPEIPSVILELDKPQPLPSDSEKTLLLRSYTAEEIAENPDDPEAYPAGSGVTMLLDIGGHEATLSEMSEGYDSQKVFWTPTHRVELLAHKADGPKVKVRLQRVTDETKAELHKEATFKVGEPITLVDDLTIVIQSLRKRRKQLLLTVEYAYKEQVFSSVDLKLDEPWAWRWEGFEVAVVNHRNRKSATVNVRSLTLEDEKGSAEDAPSKQNEAPPAEEPTSRSE